MTFEEIFSAVQNTLNGADASKIKERVVYQFTITGEGEGKFYGEIENGNINLQPYDYIDCDAELIASGDTLIKILNGKTDPVVAFTLGKLKVHKSVDKALKLKDIVIKPATAKASAKSESKAKAPAVKKPAAKAAAKPAAKTAAKPAAKTASAKKKASK